MKLRDVTPAARALSRVVVVFDGVGESATAGLYLEDANGEVVTEIEWPDDWPQWITADFVRSKGIRAEVA